MTQVTPRLYVFVGLLAGLVAGCASERPLIPSGVTEPDRYLFERGQESLDSRRWLTARQYFRQLVDGYPQSPFRADAKLAIGDSYLGEGNTEALVMAVAEFREFLTFYPTNPRGDYAQYNLGMAHYRQMRRPERDQTETRETIREFETFVERYPNSPLLEDAQERLREARNRLSESEYRVGLFYFRSRWYPGAIDRFRTILQDDPGFTNRDAVYYHLAESLLRIGRSAEALPYYERLLEEFVRSDYLANAQRRVREIKAEMDVPTE